jgi:hypothetical protein
MTNEADVVPAEPADGNGDDDNHEDVEVPSWEDEDDEDDEP